MFVDVTRAATELIGSGGGDSWNEMCCVHKASDGTVSAEGQAGTRAAHRSRVGAHTVPPPLPDGSAEHRDLTS
jgi:hypothetical protein